MLPLMITAIEDENDREFMERLYLQYHRLIYSEVRKLVQNEDEAEDLMQTVVEKLIHKVDLLRDLERRRLVNYVISSAKNTTQNFLRDKHPAARVWEEQEQLADPAPMPEEEILYREDLSGLSRAWRTLDEKTRYLLVARYILNKSGREIAEDLQMPPDNVRMALVRARRKAQQAMARVGARQ
ncbi:sigma-70 family RNA polymerase sigma factor [Oscillibacter sp. 1-3]|nr:sigma-70 family RNA polymerase sigma factor [Oscillibacter sp. 1-3]